MSAKEENVVEIQQKLEDITECPICAETYKEPKILPCIHTFCMICLQETGLKTNKSPGDKMPCPVCRTEFTIPEKDFVGLQRNFFMERLIEMKNILNPSSKSVMCDACQEDNDLGADAEIPSAEMYCVDCNQRLCEECCKIHRKYKVSKDHRLLPFDGEQINIPSIAKPYICDKHENKPLEIYCSSCQEAVCALCFFDDHKKHETTPVINAVADFRRIIQENSDSMMSFILDLKHKIGGEDNDKAAFARKVADVESEIKRIRQSLQECTDKNCDSLLNQLNSIREERIKGNESQICGVEDVLASLESYQAYCTQVTTIGSDVDICRAVHTLRTRAAELKQRYESVSLVLFPDIWLKKTEFHDTLYETDNNMIGKIEEDNTKAPVEAHSEAPGLEILRSIFDSKPDEDCDKTEDSKDSLYNATKEQLVEKVKELEQELESMKQQETERERVEKSLRKYKPLPSLIKRITKAMNSSDGKPTTVTGLTILDNELFVATRNSSDIEVYDAKTYAFKRLWRLSELKDPWDMCSCSRHNCLFIASGGSDCNEAMRFDREVEFCTKSCYQQQLNNGRILKVNAIGNLQHSWYIGEDYGTISITDEGNIILTVPVRSKIVEYDADGKCLHEIKILTADNFKVLSLSDRSYSRYSICPSHAEKLSNGFFVVNYFIFKNENVWRGEKTCTYAHVSGLCMINPEGKMIYALPGNPEGQKKEVMQHFEKSQTKIYGFGELHAPWYLAVDKEMAVLTLDRNSKRISLLSPNLDYKRKVVSEQHGLSNPYRMCLDEANHRLFVTNSDCEKDHVLVYEIKDP